MTTTQLQTQTVKKTAIVSAVPLPPAPETVNATVSFLIPGAATEKTLYECCTCYSLVAPESRHRHQRAHNFFVKYESVKF